MQSEPWYGVRLIFRSTFDPNRSAYEERVVLIHASSDEEAIAKGEICARTYEDETTTFTGYIMAFHIFDQDGPCLGEGVEVFSLIRYSDLEADAYLNRFFDTGDECSM